MECVSCHKQAQERVKFPCPECKHELVRCAKCRSLSIEYTCPKCGHGGP